MSEKPIRVLVVDANPTEAGAMPRRAGETSTGDRGCGRGP